MAAVRRDNLALGASSALAFPCSDGQPHGSTIGQVVTGNDGNYATHCSAMGLADLMPTSGDTLLTIADTGRTKLPVGVYRKIPWGEYPVATRDFSIQTGKTLRIDERVGPFAPPKSRSRRGPALTLRGTPSHFNGTFTGSVTVPTGSRDYAVAVGGLLSPTTSGRFQVVINGQPWAQDCDLRGRSPYYLAQGSPWCEIYDRHVPQVSFSGRVAGAVGRSMKVRITVEHALGPWTLQVAADRYKPDFEG